MFNFLPWMANTLHLHTCNIKKKWFKIYALNLSIKITALVEIHVYNVSMKIKSCSKNTNDFRDWLYPTSSHDMAEISLKRRKSSKQPTNEPIYGDSFVI